MVSNMVDDHELIGVVIGGGDSGPSNKRGRDGMTRVTIRCPNAAVGSVIGKGG